MERIQFIAWSFVSYLIIRLIFKLQLLGLFTGLAAVLSFIHYFLKADPHYWEVPGYQKLFQNPD